MKDALVRRVLAVHIVASFIDYLQTHFLNIVFNILAPYDI